MEPQQKQVAGPSLKPPTPHAMSGAPVTVSMRQMLRPLWVFLGLVAAYFATVLVSLIPWMQRDDPSGMGPFQGGYLMVVITVVYLPIFVMTQISATKVINRIISATYEGRPKPIIVRLLPLIVLGTVSLAVVAVDYYNYVHTNKILSHCAYCVHYYSFNPLPYVISVVVLLSPYVWLSLRGRSRKSR